MASVVRRKRRDGTVGYKVQWHAGGTRDGAWQSETFEDRRAAVKFQAQVEANGHQWPDGWVKGRGFIFEPEPEPEPAAEHSLLEFGTAYVRRLTSAGPDTRSRYIGQLHNMVRWLREIKGVDPTIENVTSDDDRDLINARLRAGVSPKTVANYHGLLSAIFRDAERKGLVARNPCAGVKLPPRDDDIDDDEDKVFLTEAEFTLLRACMHEDSKDLLTVAVGTGLRYGEISALMVKDLALDSATPTLVARRAWKRNGTGEFAITGSHRYYLGKPKTRESRRRITLSPTVTDTLRQATRGKQPDDLVFTAPHGGQLHQARWYESRWRKAVTEAQRCGLTKRPRFHDLRHTHAAWLLSAGVPIPVIQKRLGHKSIQITVDVYGGLLAQAHDVADAAMENALGGGKIISFAGHPSTPWPARQQKHGTAS